MIFLTAGPYTMILGYEARIEEVIQYADFTKRVSPVQLVDESTVDEEPNLDDLHGLMDGYITLNNSDIHVLPWGKFYFQFSCDVIKIFKLKLRPPQTVSSNRFSTVVK